MCLKSSLKYYASSTVLTNNFADLFHTIIATTVYPSIKKVKNIRKQTAAVERNQSLIRYLEFIKNYRNPSKTDSRRKYDT